MNHKQAQNLQVGDSVRHMVDEVQGKVEYIFSTGLISIQWEDGKYSSYEPEDMCEIDLVEVGQ
jgi:hypothetical protein